ncbi:MAG: bifunctional glycosyltransferase family 2/GtrA family protein [Clostridia bacterium]|nr:bifunctional glycosyltransferase family 2/GtrA family protein [Clostridia bacterium]
MKIALIVPAYRPTRDMLPMLSRFAQDEAFVPVVVNDGSGPEYAEIFAAVPEGCILLTHEVNKGKGAALKTAIAYVLDKLPECELAVTADADGQHRYEDIRRVTDVARQHPGTLVLGSRAFDGDVPFKSRWGNAITREVFAIASGVKIRDTQTGLRAFDRACMEKFRDIPGERYEYEINMLLYAAREGIDMKEETIETVYIDDNSASSFHPFRDSFKIYACILKFAASSLLAFIVDAVMVLVMMAVTGGNVRLSQVVARVVSSTVNFIVNKKVVYQSKQDWLPELLKYAALAIVNLAINLLLVKPLSDLLAGRFFLAYLIVQVVMYALNFVLQGKLVYNRKK